METEKTPKSFSQNILKNVCSRDFYEKQEFTALCFKSIFHVFQKNSSESFFKMDNYKCPISKNFMTFSFSIFREPMKVI